MKKVFLLMAICYSLFSINACKQGDKKTEAVAEEKETPAPEIPMRDFFKNPVKGGFQISHDGTYFSYLAPYKNKRNVFVQKIGDTNAIRVTSDTVRQIMQYQWKGDKIVYLQDVGGDENFQLFTVNKDGSGMKAITPFPKVRTFIFDDLRSIPGKENQIIIGMNKRNPEYFDPYLVDLQTGTFKILYDNKENFDSWGTDNNGVIRVANKTDGVNNKMYYRASENEPFQLIMTTSFKEIFFPMGFAADNLTMYTASNIGRDKVAVVEFDPVNKKELKEIYSNADYDIEYMFYSKKRKVPTHIVFQADRQQYHFLDEETKSMYSKLEKEFPGYDYQTYSNNDAEDKFIVWVGSDRLPAKYYFYDKSADKIELLAEARPWIKETDMARMKPVEYKSRDGLTIRGYLTLPKGIEAKNLPVVVNPHGGPWARDTWGFNPEVQFLANKGYAVLQMNFRGSTGYGRKFWESSFKQWGKAMQDDITDGVKWLIDQGIADPKRVGIYGGSYGGYATLMGITKEPDLYAAAVDYVGVSNLFTFMKTVPPYWKPFMDQMHEMVGDPSKDSLAMVETSPALNADKIKVPLFIAQGANDPRVNKAESDQVVEALKKKGINVEYMVKNDEGHGFLNEENRLDFYGAMEKFLDKNLKNKKALN